MESGNIKDKEQEIRYLRKIIDAYEKVTNLSNEELIDAYKIISCSRKSWKSLPAKN